MDHLAKLKNELKINNDKIKTLKNELDEINSSNDVLALITNQPTNTPSDAELNEGN